MGLPQSNIENEDRQSIYDAPQMEDIEEALSTFVFSLYRIDAREYRNYRQRSILVTLQTESVVKKQLDELAAEITELEGREEGDEYQIELLSNEDFIEIGREQRPQDSVVKSLTTPLTVAKRSPNTGRIFREEEYKYCPQTQAPLRYVIAAARAT